MTKHFVPLALVLVIVIILLFMFPSPKSGGACAGVKGSVSGGEKKPLTQKNEVRGFSLG